MNPSAEVFGVHENAEITTAQNQSLLLLEDILSIQPRSVSKSGRAREDIIFERAAAIENKTPEVFDIEEIYKQFPPDYNESMNTVLIQELHRYNKLFAVMKTSLFNLKKALKGLVVMSDELEKLSNSIYDNQVGKLWSDKGFLSLKPLGSWIEDLNNRHSFLEKWVKEGTPKVFWMSGFFFPQAFVTGSLQNYSRSQSIAIDKLHFEYKYLDTIATHESIEAKPEYGCYIYGIYLEGGRWDTSKSLLG